MSVIERIDMLIKQHSINDTTLTKGAVITRGLLLQWRKKQQNPSTDAIIIIANYFDVNTDYLLRGYTNHIFKGVDIMNKEARKELFKLDDMFFNLLDDIHRYKKHENVVKNLKCGI